MAKSIQVHTSCLNECEQLRDILVTQQRLQQTASRSVEMEEELSQRLAKQRLRQTANHSVELVEKGSQRRTKNNLRQVCM